ncbi:MAG: alpha/beta hydrolase [Pseudomonadota bacterium]
MDQDKALPDLDRVAESIRAPSLALAMTEALRAVAELSLLPASSLRLLKAPRGDGHPVLFLPGFLTSDLSTTMMRSYLSAIGYNTYPWELGRNLGIRTTGLEWGRVRQRVEALALEAGTQVSLVGWSLGGIMARRVARHIPQHVRQVITLGSPFTGNPMATNATHLYQTITGDYLNRPDAKARYADETKPVPVPSTAIYSRQDGVTAWQNCIDAREDGQTENVELYSSHMGLPFNPAVWFVIADRLAQPKGQWKPFDRSGRRRLYYPTQTD